MDFPRQTVSKALSMFFFFSRLTEERALGKENKNIKRRGMGEGEGKVSARAQGARISHAWCRVSLSLCKRCKRR